MTDDTRLRCKGCRLVSYEPVDHIHLTAHMDAGGFEWEPVVVLPAARAEALLRLETALADENRSVQALGLHAYLDAVRSAAVPEGGAK
jgi:hypothetical protein